MKRKKQNSLVKEDFVTFLPVYFDLIHELLVRLNQSQSKSTSVSNKQGYVRMLVKLC